MKVFEKIASALLACVMLFSMMFTRVFAHNALLDVEYDTCVSFADGDGVDEMWYVLDHPNACHISQTVETIKYCFAEESIEGDCTWTTAVTPNITEETANEIKSSYATSMEKWNNVCFYTYDYSRNIIKNRVITVQQGSITDEDVDLIIYPSSLDEEVIAGAAWLNRVSVEGENVEHYHAAEWIMEVCVSKFVFGGTESVSDVEAIRESTGAHELGHMLGLGDIDSHCTASQVNGETVDNWHHLELLMGYGLPVSNRSSDITYKDIAGVAITRGFHTDSDHKWLNAGLSGSGYKLICSICNGVKYVDSLRGYTYYPYLSCGSNHALASGNMMAVASYGDKDYYKCKYCRYVAPFSSIVTQDYALSNHSDSQHKYTNNVDGLEYTFYEDHAYNYTWLNLTQHKKICSCGKTSNHPHVTKSGSPTIGGYRVCIICGGRVSVGVIMSNAINALSRTDNGSYILPNGVIVLVDEDIEAYMNGTLVFHDADDTPTVE